MNARELVVEKVLFFDSFLFFIITIILHFQINHAEGLYITSVHCNHDELLGL